MLYVFILLTVLHPIADFIIQPIWYVNNPRKAKIIHYVVALNPLHALWDSQTRFRKHREYDMGSRLFWQWTGVDQFVHVVLNLIFAAIVEAVLWVG